MLKHLINQLLQMHGDYGMERIHCQHYLEDKVIWIGIMAKAIEQQGLYI